MAAIEDVLLDVGDMISVVEAMNTDEVAEADEMFDGGWPIILGIVENVGDSVEIVSTDLDTVQRPAVIGSTPAS